MGAMLFNKSQISNRYRAVVRKKPDDEEEITIKTGNSTKFVDKERIHASKTMKLSSRSELFYAWECVSLVLENFTIDFVIKDSYHMMYFLHILQHNTMQTPPAGVHGCLKPFKFLKVKMKLTYQCWLQQYSIKELWYFAFLETLKQLRRLAIYKLQRILVKVDNREQDQQSP